ncbi:hypothetical protein ACROYT_G003502 [Oculina patagonica]
MVILLRLGASKETIGCFGKICPLEYRTNHCPARIQCYAVKHAVTAKLGIRSRGAERVKLKPQRKDIDHEGYLLLSPVNRVNAGCSSWTGSPKR